MKVMAMDRFVLESLPMAILSNRVLMWCVALGCARSLWGGDTLSDGIPFRSADIYHLQRNRCR